MTFMGVSGVLTRIQDIQTQLNPNAINPDGATVVPGTVSTLGGSGADPTFAALLDNASGGQSTDAGGGVTGDAVVADAKKYLGIPYAFGSTDPSKGLDCSSLVQRAYADLGVQLPRNSWEQAKAGQPVAGLADAKPGDILAFGSPVHHVGIYLGDNQMIAAPHTGDHVKIQKVYDKPTQIRRVVTDADQVAAQNMASIRPASLNGNGGLDGVPY